MASTPPKQSTENADALLSRRARDRLSGALSMAIDSAQNSPRASISASATATATGSNGAAADAAYLLEGIPDLAAGLDTPYKRILHSDSPWNSPTKSPRHRRRRKKDADTGAGAFHHTFVMKLFERSVDLAQFAENQKTSLYPVCRAWIKNQPQNTNFAPRKRTPTPEPPKEEEDEYDDNNDDVSGPPTKKSKKEPMVYQLPDYIPLEKNANGDEISLKTPLREENKSNMKGFEPNQEPTLTRLDLLNSHRKRWQLVRNEWKRASRINEQRYLASNTVLKQMYENS